LTQNYTYFDTGNVNVFSDVNDKQVNGSVTTNAETTYTYGDCGNSFATTVAEPQSLSRTYAWSCTGGVTTLLKDENSQSWSTIYNDPNYWRPTSTEDPASAITNLCYWPGGPSGCASNAGLFGSESTLNFNGSISTVDSLTALDGLGRVHVTQTRQAQSGAYDSVETDYNAQGLPYQFSVPYTGTAGCSYETAPSCASPSGTTPSRANTTYDALGRPLTVTDGGGGTTTYTYTEMPGSTQRGFDVLVQTGPAPSGENLKQRQFEYDGLDRLTSVCEITSATGVGAGSCSQSVPATGFWTQYTYDALNDIINVKQNAQSGISYQSRTYVYDGLGRIADSGEGNRSFRSDVDQD
jgi:hypothetical protein